MNGQATKNLHYYIRCYNELKTIQHLTSQHFDGYKTILFAVVYPHCHALSHLAKRSFTDYLDENEAFPGDLPNLLRFIWKYRGYHTVFLTG